MQHRLTTPLDRISGWGGGGGLRQAEGSVQGVSRRRRQRAAAGGGSLQVALLPVALLPLALPAMSPASHAVVMHTSTSSAVAAYRRHRSRAAAFSNWPACCTPLCRSFLSTHHTALRT